MAIHRLAFGGVVQRTRCFLDVGPAITSKYTHMICEALVDNFYDKYIKIHGGQQLEIIMARFQKIINITYMWGGSCWFPYCNSQKSSVEEVPDNYYN